MKTILSTYTSYNLWANIKITGTVKSIELSLLDKEVKSSFPSLRKTMHHIWGAEEIWYKRLHGEFLASLPDSGNDFSEFAKQFHARSQSFVDVVSGKDENYLLTPCAYKDIRGNPHSNLPWEMIHHCMNHSLIIEGRSLRCCGKWA